MSPKFARNSGKDWDDDDGSNWTIDLRFSSLRRCQLRKPLEPKGCCGDKDYLALCLQQRMHPQAGKMILGRLPGNRVGVTVLLAILLTGFTGRGAWAATSKQQSLDQWRNLTSPPAEPPRVFVKGDDVRFYFHDRTNEMEFTADWHHLRVPTEGYRVNSALIRWKQNLSRQPELNKHGWREATVIAGTEWRRLATNLLETLTPKSPGHGAFYQAFLSDRVLYRDAQGNARFALEGRTTRRVDH